VCDRFLHVIFVSQEHVRSEVTYGSVICPRAGETQISEEYEDDEADANDDEPQPNPQA
jgi:hypothetical protein